MTTNDKLRALCRRCVERSEALGYRGKRRDDFTMDYFAAAAVTAELTGDKEFFNHINLVGVMLISVRGFAEVKKIAEEKTDA